MTVHLSPTSSPASISNKIDALVSTCLTLLYSTYLVQILDGETRSIYWVCSNPHNVQYEHDEKFKEEKNYPQLCHLEVTFLSFFYVGICIFNQSCIML